MFRRDLIYVQVHKGHLVGRSLNTGQTIKIDCSGLDHPRTLIGDYLSVEDAFNQLRSDFRAVWLPLQRPNVLVHLVPLADGGYTNVELRGFREAAESLHPHKMRFHVGETLLRDDEVPNAFEQSSEEW